MSPRRDPHTGKYVSGDKPSNWDRRATYTGGLFVGIPAADNDGTANAQTWTGDTGMLIDFDQELHSDELFHLTHLEWSASLALPTTSTEEGTALVGYILGTDAVGPGVPLTTTSLTAHPNPDNQEGIIDTVQEQDADDSVLMTGILTAENSFLDTVNALGGGADAANETRSFRPTQDLDWAPTFDAEDELYVTGEMETQNVADNQTTFTVQAVAHGWVEDFD